MNKDNLQSDLNIMHAKSNIKDSFDEKLLSEKVEQALLESEQGLGQNWDEFKKEWIKK